MRVILGVTESDASMNAFYWVKNNPLRLWKQDLDLTIVHILNNQVDSGLALLRKFELLAKNFAKTVSTKLLPRQKSVGHTLKEFVANFENPLLVIGSNNQKWKVVDYCVKRCECPVVVVKRDHSTPPPTKPILGLAMDVNVHCDRAFSWLLKNAQLPDISQLYVVHITPKKTDKPDARKFLSALKPKCLESKRMYSMASALVSYDRGGVADGILKFSHDKNLATLIIASKGERQLPRLRLTTSITEDCLRSSSLDIIVWQDEQTRNVCASPYIWSGNTGITPIKLSTWENSKGSQKTKQKVASQETKSSTKPSAHPPSYPRPIAQSASKTLHQDAPLAPISESYATPISEDGSKQRRKNSLKYYMYDQIARGKNQLTKLTEDDSSNWYGETVEPLSP